MNKDDYMNRKGMTLIEVIVSVFLIGLIASVFLPSISSSFSFMARSKDITVDVFLLQKQVEQEMEVMRDRINDFNEGNSHSEPRTKSIRVFDKDIPYVPIVEEISSMDKRGKIYSIIATGHIGDENLPKVSDISLKKSLNKPLYGVDNTIYLLGSHIIDSSANYLMDIKKWYVSKEGFDGYIPTNIVNELDWGSRYPAWPTDYEVIPNIERDSLSNLSNYLGRHIVYSVTPISKLGQYGVETRSNSLYVMGPPFKDNMTLHLDTYVLENADNTSFTNWQDLSGNSNNANGISGSSVELNFENGKFAEFRNDTFRTSTSNPTSNNTMTLFFVFNNASSQNISQNLINRNNSDRGWALYLNEGKIEFLINPSTNRESDRVLESNISIENDKYIVSVLVSNHNIDMILDKNGETLSFSLARGNNSNFAGSNINTTIGGSNSELNISEIIIYNAALSNDEINKTREFLANKHRIELQVD